MTQAAFEAIKEEKSFVKLVCAHSGNVLGLRSKQPTQHHRQGTRFACDEVDLVPPGASLRGYALTVVPSLPIVRGEALRAFQEAEGIVLFGPRSGSKTETFRISREPPPGPLQALLPLKVVRVESLPPGLWEVAEGPLGRFPLGLWREWVEAPLRPLLTFQDGKGALYREGQYLYLAAWPSPELAGRLLSALAAEAGLKVLSLPEGLRLRRRGTWVFAFNYGPEAVEAPAPEGARFLLGGRWVGPCDLAVWEEA